MTRTTVLQLLHTNVSDLVPRGRRLADPVWRQRHRSMVVLIVAHAVGFAVYGAMTNAGAPAIAFQAGPPAAAAALAVAPWLRRSWRSFAAVLGLLSSSALLLQATNGRTDSHFHFFVMIAIIALYQQWSTFGLAFGFVLLHHAVIGVLAPDVVFDTPAAQQRPLLWTAVHGGYILAACAASMVAWRLIEKERERAERVLDSTAEGVYEVDTDGRITFANSAVGRILGCDEERLLGRDHHDALSHDAGEPGAEDRSVCMACAVTTKISGRSAKSTFRRHDGAAFPVECTGHPVVEKGRQIGSVMTFRDRTTQAMLTRQALYDDLTGLANRSLLLEHLEHALARIDRNRTALAILFCDLDEFKPVNDTFGHAAGDELLMVVSGRLQEAVRAHDTVARFGGDEFVALCTDLASERDALTIAERFLEALREPIVVSGQQVQISASVGLTVTTNPSSAPELLLGEADAAMYRAKEKGRNRVEVFDEELRARATKRLQLEDELRTAIAQGELRVHYQPKVSLISGALAGVEALVRWQHPELGLVRPAEFLAVAEESGLIVPLGQYVLEESCRQLARWRTRGGVWERCTLSVNLSCQQLAHTDLVETVRAALHATGVPGERLCLEVSEQVLMDDAPLTIDTLRSLKRLGVTLAVDDFGTGFSSLSYLTNAPIDVLKVDRSLVSTLHQAKESWSVVAAALGLSRCLGLSAVAEGVEQTDQADALRDLGCEHAQGYHFAAPQSAAALEALLDTETGCLAAISGLKIEHG
ncbi:MAG: putative bifunctional diguanylate cyclase/phosphodiesterase [Egibacteraceae bacterium]